MRWTVRKKMTLSFVLIAALGIILSSIVLYYLEEVSRSSYFVVKGARESELLADLRFKILQQLTAEKEFLLTGDEKRLEAHNWWSSELKNSFKALEEAAAEERKSEIIGLKELSKKYESAFLNIVDLTKTKRGDKAEAIRLSTEESGKEANELMSQIEVLITRNKEATTEYMDAANKSFAVRFRTVAFSVALVGFSIAMSLFLSNKLSQPIRKLAVFADEVRKGSISQSAEIDTKDEIGDLAEMFNKLVSDLKDEKLKRQMLIDELKNTAEQLSAASEQLLATVQQHERTFNEQSSAIIETTSTVEELTNTSKAIASNTSKVVDLAQETTKAVDEGQDIINRSLQGLQGIRQKVDTIGQRMGILNERTKDINEIVGQITNLSDKVNILALNAAIEAARAQSNGSGFAVIADNIKKLSEQSAELTKSITKIISEIQSSTALAVLSTEEGSKSVNEGANLAGKSGETFELIRRMADETADSITKVSLSIQQNQSAMLQINEAMASIGSETQKSMSSLSQTTAAAESLANLAAKIRTLVEQLESGGKN